MATDSCKYESIFVELLEDDTNISIHIKAFIPYKTSVKLMYVEYGIRLVFKK